MKKDRLDIFDFIEFQENALIKILDILRRSKYDNFIYEASTAEIFVEQVLLKNHVPFAGNLVTQNCIDSNDKTFPIEDFFRNCRSKINLIIAREEFDELLEVELNLESISESKRGRSIFGSS